MDDTDSKKPVKKLVSFPLPNNFKSQLKIIKGYIVWRGDIEQPLDGEDYSTITTTDMNAYRLSNVYTAYLAHGALSTDNPKVSSKITTEDPLLSAFKRGIKRDPTQFNTFRRDSDWDEWHSHVTITAMGQGVDDILDSAYTPIGPDALVLFNEK